MKHINNGTLTGSDMEHGFWLGMLFAMFLVAIVVSCNKEENTSTGVDSSCYQD